MKRLYLMRGCPGCGKSSLIKKLGLEEYSISTDAIRLEISGTELVDGREVISQKDNSKVFEIVRNRIESRMGMNLPIILDATNLSSTSVYYKIAEKYGYEVVVVDFKVSLKVLLERNKTRGIHYVPEEVIKKMYDKKSRSSVREGVRVIRPSDLKHDWISGMK